MIDETFDYPAYLSAKKGIDDLSLNKQVWSTMCHWLSKRQLVNNHLNILEIGAGIGTMIERVYDQNIISKCHYTALEKEPEFKDHARDRLSSFFSSKKLTFQELGTGWEITTGNTHFVIDWISGDAMEIEKNPGHKGYDLVICHAVIDLLPVPEFLPRLFKVLNHGSGYYFSLNFSGNTEFFPRQNEDEIIYSSYHQDMDKRFKNVEWQCSLTGKMLGKWLIEHGHKVIASGPSDWRLSAEINNDNSLFISNILDTIEKALAGLPELEPWINLRRKQLKSGKLEFLASNIDYFGVV